MYKKILIADDLHDEVKSLINLFQSEQYEVIYVSNPEEADKVICFKDVDLLILDWYFTIPNSSALAMEVVDSLVFNRHFIPVFIYSNSVITTDEIDETFPKGYPRSLINAMEKPNPSNAKKVKSIIDKWFIDNPTVRLAKEWYDSFDDAMRKSLEEMYLKAGDGVIKLLGNTYRTEKDKGINNIIALITSIIQHNLMQDSKLIKDLEGIINSNISLESNDYSNYETVRSFEMYSTIKDEAAIGTGDIFLFDSDICVCQQNLFKLYN